jgi:hypothetical protein
MNTQLLSESVGDKGVEGTTSIFGAICHNEELLKS